MQNHSNRNLENMFSFACLAAGRTIQEAQVVSPVFRSLAPGPPDNETKNETASPVKQNQPEQRPVQRPQQKTIQKRMSSKEDQALRMSFGDPNNIKEVRTKEDSNPSDKSKVGTEKSVRDSGSIGRPSRTASIKHTNSMKSSIESKRKAYEGKGSVVVSDGDGLIDNILKQDGISEKDMSSPVLRYASTSDDTDIKKIDSRENIKQEHVRFHVEDHETTPLGRTSYSPPNKYKEYTRANKRSKPKIKRNINSKSEERRAQKINRSAERKIRAILSNFDPQAPGFWRWGQNYKLYPPYGVAPENLLADGLNKKDCLNNSTLIDHKRFWGIEKRMQELKDVSGFTRPDPLTISPLRSRTPHRIPKSSSHTEQSPISDVYETVGLKFMNTQNASFVINRKDKENSLERQDESNENIMENSQYVKTEPIGLPEIKKSSHRRADSYALETDKSDTPSRRTLSQENRDNGLYSPMVKVTMPRANAHIGYKAYNTGKLTPINNLASYEGGAPHIYVANRSYTTKSGNDLKNGISLIVTPSVQETQEDLAESNPGFPHEGLTPSSANENYRSVGPFLQVDDTKGIYEQHTTDVTESTFRRTFRGTSRSRGDEWNKINSESLVRNMYKGRIITEDDNTESRAQLTTEDEKSSRKVLQQVLKSRRKSGDYQSLLDQRGCGFAMAKRRPVQAGDQSPGPIYNLSSYKGVMKPSKGFLTEDDLWRMARVDTEVKQSNRSFITTTGRDSDTGRKSGQPMIMSTSDRRKSKRKDSKGAHFGTAKRDEVFSPKMDVPGPGEYNMPHLKLNGGVHFGKEKKGIGL